MNSHDDRVYCVYTDTADILAAAQRLRSRYARSFILRCILCSAGFLGLLRKIIVIDRRGK
jgi:hypothetical protein